jgi:hypothetical protein
MFITLHKNIWGGDKQQLVNVTGAASARYLNDIWVLLYFTSKQNRQEILG